MTPRQKQAKFRSQLKDFAICLLVSFIFMVLITAFLYAGFGLPTPEQDKFECRRWECVK